MAYTEPTAVAEVTNIHRANVPGRIPTAPDPVFFVITRTSNRAVS